MKRALSASVVILTFAITSAAQANCARRIETAGGLSFCPPEGWIEEKKAEDKYSRFFGPAQEGFTANLNIKDETSALLLPDYVAGSIKRILLPASAEKMGATSVKLVNQSEFITTSSLRGFKVEFRTECQLPRRCNLVVWAASSACLTGEDCGVNTFRITKHNEANVAHVLLRYALYVSRSHRAYFLHEGCRIAPPSADQFRLSQIACLRRISLLAQVVTRQVVLHSAFQLGLRNRVVLEPPNLLEHDTDALVRVC